MLPKHNTGLEQLLQAGIVFVLKRFAYSAISAVQQFRVSTSGNRHRHMGRDRGSRRRERRRIRSMSAL